jgi:septal ring factor EnvC (AmiA/AmiB activator)
MPLLCKARRKKVENKKINLVFNLVVIFFLALTFILIRDLNANRSIDYKEYSAMISKIVRDKNTKIRVLYNELQAQQQENEQLKNTLAVTRNGLNALSKNIVQPVAAGVTVPGTAAK